ncbi:MAG TPA: diacylglycerol kinase family protein [Nitrososphaeraceae archaeon]|nr:diacylglycerol kinase family protein [Nitrososphaeraceae archaeon]
MLKIDNKLGSTGMAIESNIKRTETAIVVNPNSASGLTGKNWDNLHLMIKRLFGDNSEIAFTEKSGDGTNLTRNFIKKGYKKIVAIGGDGTINEVANGFFEEDIRIHGGGSSEYNNKDNDSFLTQAVFKPINSAAVMAVFPCGTRNVLVKSLDLPADFAECCLNFETYKLQKVDVISVKATNIENHSKTAMRIYLNAAEIGIGAEVIDKAKKVRSVVNNRLISTVTGLVTTVPTYESSLCEISIDDGHESILTKMTMGVVANGKFLGGGFKAAPEANILDGLLDVVILKESSSLEMIENFLNIKDGNYTNEGDVFYRQAKKVSIKSKENRDITVTIDGEPIGILPATFEVLQNALTILM